MVSKRGPGRPKGARNKKQMQPVSGRRPGILATDLPLREICEKQRSFIEALDETRGMIHQACRKTGTSRSCYYKWVKSYPDFKIACDIVREEQIDFVECKLLQNINEGRETSINFYLGTKGKGRGYTSRNELVNKEVTDFDEQDKEIMDQMVRNMKVVSNGNDE